MKKYLIWIGSLLSAALATACFDNSQTNIHDLSPVRDGFQWEIPEKYALPYVPAKNPVTEAKFQLGRHLFYDQRISKNGEIACSNCHQQAFAFTEPRARSLGLNGAVHPRNAQPLANSAYMATLTWANPLLQDLENQIVIPLFTTFPISEHGLDVDIMAEIIPSLEQDPAYKALITAAYPDTPHLDTDKIVFSIATFVRGINSFNSAYDRFEAGDYSALSQSAKDGMQLFFNDERLECFHCHSGINFSDSYRDASMSFTPIPFHNTGLYNLDSMGSYPKESPGVYDTSLRPEDHGRFRTATLRNIELTAPYMHDGSIASLSAVIEFYAAGGRNIQQGPHKGDGRYNINKSEFVRGFTITDQEKKDLIEFLKSLTDYDLINNPRFSNPWK